MKLDGLAVSPGRVQGTVVWLRKTTLDPHTHGSIRNPEELRIRAIQELRHIAKTASSPVLADVLNAQAEMVDDPELWDAVSQEMDRGKTLVDAVKIEIERLVQQFAGLEDPHLASRSDDIRDLGNHLLALMAPASGNNLWPATEPSILVADTLFPSDTARLNLAHVIGIVLSQGTVTSHVAILSRSLQIPAVVVEDVHKWLKDGDRVLVDGSQGHVSDENLQEFLPRPSVKTTVHTGPVATKDGVPIRIEANIGSRSEALMATQYGSDGIGLLRTEFLFSGDHMPTEAEQYQALYEIAEASPKGSPIIIRAVDVGGDKPLPYLELPVEPNPFLGTRAGRLLARYPNLYHDQIRAVLRLSQHFNVHLMFPMIATFDDWKESQNCMTRALQSLNLTECPIPMGIMVEVPSVALLAADFAKHVDFFSIGTNDLIQYLFAADRSVSQLARYYRPTDPAVIKALRMTVKGAQSAQIPVGMCGEMAGNDEYLPILIGLGLRELSATPASIPRLKEKVASLTMAECEEAYRGLVDPLKSITSDGEALV